MSSPLSRATPSLDKYFLVNRPSIQRRKSIASNPTTLRVVQKTSEVRPNVADQLFKHPGPLQGFDSLIWRQRLPQRVAGQNRSTPPPAVRSGRFSVRTRA